MQNLFYVPPHQPQDIHPRTPGVRTIVKRSQPTRLDLSVPGPGLTVTPHTFETRVHALSDRTAAPRRSLRRIVGAALIRAGQRIAGPLPAGQPG